MTLKYNFWIRCSKKIMFNFINVKDVAEVVQLLISKLKVSRNKTYMVSDDCKQSLVYENYQYYINKKIKIINVKKSFKIFINLLPWPKKFLIFLKLFH